MRCAIRSGCGGWFRGTRFSKTGQAEAPLRPSGRKVTGGMAERPGLRPDEQTEIPFRRRQNAPRRQFSGSLRRVAVFGPYRSASDGQAARRGSPGTTWVSPPILHPGRRALRRPPIAVRLRRLAPADSRSIRSRRRFGSPAERASLATGRGESRTRPSSGGLVTLGFLEDERSQEVGGAGYAGNRRIVSIPSPPCSRTEWGG